MDYLDFFSWTGLFTALQPTLCIKKLYKNLLNYFSLKQKNQGDSVKNESARGKIHGLELEHSFPHYIFYIYRRYLQKWTSWGIFLKKGNN